MHRLWRAELHSTPPQPFILPYHNNRFLDGGPVDLIDGEADPYRQRALGRDAVRVDVDELPQARGIYVRFPGQGDDGGAPTHRALFEQAFEFDVHAARIRSVEQSIVGRAPWIVSAVWQIAMPPARLAVRGVGPRWPRQLR